MKRRILKLTTLGGVALVWALALIMALGHANNALGQEPGTPAPLPATALSPVVTTPSEFIGTVTIDGAPAPDGTPIEALIGSTVCGSDTTRGGRYDIVVRSGHGSGQEFQEGCGGSGPNTSTVVFRTGSLLANETGRFIGHTAVELNLTFGQAPAPYPPTNLPNSGQGIPRTGAMPQLAAALWGLLAVGALAFLSSFVERRRAR